MSYKVGQADVSEVQDTLMGIWERNLSVGPALGKRFDWYYQQNPAGRGATFLLNHKGTEAEPKPVGSTGVFLRHFTVDGEPLTAGILGDVAVDQQHRTFFPAMMLQRAARKYGNEQLGFIYGFPNKLALPLYERLKVRKLGQMVRYALPLSVEEYVRRKVRLSPALGTAVGIVDKAWRSVDGLRERMLPRACALQWLDDVDSRFDDLWQRSHSRHAVIACRDAAFLRWRFVNKPDETFEFAVMCCPKLEAYAVVQQCENFARIVDIFGSSERTTDRLLTMLTPSLRERGIHAVTTRFLGAPRLAALLQQHGFRQREAEWAVIVEPAQCSQSQRQTLLDPTNWYLTDGDEDT